MYLLVLMGFCAHISARTVSATTKLHICLTAESLDIVPKFSPTTVVHGRLAVIAVDAKGELPPDGILSAQLDDGRKVPAVIRWIGVVRENAHEVETSWQGMDTWLGGIAGPAKWIVLGATDSPPPNADGSYVVFTEIPVNAFGQGVWIEGTRCDLAWVGDPALESNAQQSPRWSVRASSEAIESAALYELTEPARNSPLSRWRVRLAYEGLKPLYSMLDHSGPTIDANGQITRVADNKPFVGWRRFESPALEAVALQLEGQWQTGLTRLEHADHAVYEQAISHLAAVAEFSSREGIVHAPVWREDPVQTDELLRTLNRATTRDDEMVSEVVRWLDRQPALLLAIEDDGGRPASEPGGATVQIGMLRLRNDSALVVAASAGAQSPTEPIAIAPWSWMNTDVPVGVTAITRAINDAGGEPARAQLAVEGRMDRQRAWAPARPAKLRASPPFLALGPMMNVRTLRDLYTNDMGSIVVPGIPGGTAVHLQKTSIELAGNTNRTNETIAAPGSALAWRLFIECDALDSAADPGDCVSVWLGPTGSARLSLTIDRAGGVRRTFDDEYLTNHSAVVVPGDHSWTCILTVPESCIEVDGTLRVGIERTSRAGRSTLGRSVFPWQREPGRIAVDTLAWK